MTRAMLLCAGFGTRLGQLSEELPKPLLPVCDYAIARFGIAVLVGHRIRDIVINVHHKGDLIERELGDGRALGARIQYSREPEILGTGGGIKRALPLLDPEGRDEPIVVMNGKLIFDLDVTALVAAHRADREALGTLVVRKVADAKSWGALDVGGEGAGGRLRVHDILGDGEYMFCGVHVTRPSVMARLPEGASCSLRQGYLPWIRAGETVAAFAADQPYFAEHSTPARYLKSNIDLLRGVALRFRPGPLAGIDDTAHIDSTAIIRHPVRVGAAAHIGEQATVGPDAVIGSHAVVEAGANVQRSIVWTGGRAAGPVRGKIVTALGVVDAEPDLSLR